MLLGNGELLLRGWRELECSVSPAHNRTSKWLVPELENAIASRNLYEASVQLQYPGKIWAVALDMVQDKSKLPWEVFSSQALPHNCFNHSLKSLLRPDLSHCEGWNSLMKGNATGRTFADISRPRRGLLAMVSGKFFGAHYFLSFFCCFCFLCVLDSSFRSLC